MRLLRAAVAPALVLSLAVSAMAGQWMTSYKSAIALSRKTGKPILADFTGSDWCGWCMKLHKEVFETPEFDAWAKKNVILLEVDYPEHKKQSRKIKKQNEKLAKKYQIDLYPTILFLNAKGVKLGRYGYEDGGPDNWTKKAEAMFKGKK